MKIRMLVKIKYLPGPKIFLWSCKKKTKTNKKEEVSKHKISRRMRETKEVHIKQPSCDDFTDSSSQG